MPAHQAAFKAAEEEEKRLEDEKKSGLSKNKAKVPKKKDLSEEEHRMQMTKEDDPDPVGEKLAATKEPLEVATKVLRHMLEFATARPDTHLLAAQLYTRKRKFLLAARGLQKAFALQPDSPALHEAQVFFLDTLQRCEAELHPTVKAVLEAERQCEALGSGKSAEEHNEAFLGNKASSSALHRLAGARSLLLLAPKDAAVAKRAVELLSSVAREASREDRAAVLEFLKGVDQAEWKKAAVEAAESVRAVGRELFPLATAFLADDESTKLDEKLKLQREADIKE